MGRLSRKEAKEYSSKVDEALKNQKTRGTHKPPPTFTGAAEILKAAKRSGNVSLYLQQRIADPEVQAVYKRWRATTHLGKRDWKGPED